VSVYVYMLDVISGAGDLEKLSQYLLCICIYVSCVLLRRVFLLRVLNGNAGEIKLSISGVRLGSEVFVSGVRCLCRE
jgi:hypothetical protein